ncbi:MAG: VanZ family protein [Lachnospiraceae bacterium]|nr:VanZ family protein [Lachnospiraceae bacterium]
MKRRNVLGNQIEESKTMWIVLMGLLACVLQFVIYYFVGSNWLGLLLGGLAVLLGGVLVHIITGEQEELFAYLLIPCVCSGIAGLLIPKLGGQILPESSTVLYGCLFSWLLPVLYACIFTWVAGHTAIGQFAEFYKRASVFFYMVYFGSLIYWFGFLNHAPSDGVTLQLVPFTAFAGYVEGVINGTVPVRQLLGFLTEHVLLFLPYGFFIGMVCRKLHGIVHLLLVLVFPAVVELLQYLLKWNSFIVDDIIFSLLGGLLGLLCFVGFNLLFQQTTGKNFDASEVDRDYYGRKI